MSDHEEETAPVNPLNDWESEYKQLKHKATVQDNRDIFKLLNYSKTTTMKKDVQNLITTEERLQFERAVEKQELDNFIKVLRKDLSSMKRSLKQYNQQPEEIENVQNLTDDIENKISSFKERQMVNFDKLLEEENRLTSDIQQIVEKMDQYEKPSEIPEPKATTFIPTRSTLKSMTSTGSRSQRVESVHSERERSADDPAIIQARLEFQKKANKLKESIQHIDKEISNFGGKGAGWSDEDHQAFLRIKTKHRGNMDSEVFRTECLQALPFLDELTVEEHVEKHKMYLELEEQKKQLLKKYREFREAHQLKEKNHTQSQENLDDFGLKRIRPSFRIQRTADDKARLKDDIKDWKEKRAKSKVSQKEHEWELELLKKKERDDKIKRRQAEISGRVKEYKAHKENEKAQRLAKEVEEQQEKNAQKRHFTKEELQRFKEREDQLIKKQNEKLEKHKMRILQQTQRAQKLVDNDTTISSHFKDVQPKFNVETQAAAMKKRNKFDYRNELPKIADNYGGVFHKNAGKAVPQWKMG